jgi:hypothetical protein
MDLKVMLPMVASVGELDQARALIDREIDVMRRRTGGGDPASISIGVMIEVPSLLYDLDAVFKRVDFASVGSNDLLQYLFAADRNNDRTATRYDVLSAPALRALHAIAAAGRRHGKTVTLCGEMAGRPLEAMALVALGYRSLSMTASAIGPVKAMIVGLDAERAQTRVEHAGRARRCARPRSAGGADGELLRCAGERRVRDRNAHPAGWEGDPALVGRTDPGWTGGGNCHHRLCQQARDLRPSSGRDAQRATNRRCPTLEDGRPPALARQLSLPFHRGRTALHARA